MQKALPVIAVIVVVGVLSLFAYVFRDRFNKKPAGLTINSSPTAAVFLNDKNVGNTPYDNANLPAGTYTLRLVPEEEGGVTRPPWETRLDLSPQVTAVVSRQFAETEADSSGSVLQLVKDSVGKTYLSVISDPDNITLAVDSEPRGFTPLTKVEISPGSHHLNLTSPGFKPQEMNVSIVQGYNLIVSVKLAADPLVLTPPQVSTTSASLATASPIPSPLASQSPSPATPSSSLSMVAKPYVLIKETGTGWLRVRQEPSSTGAELGKANVGEKFPYLGESTESGWHKIQFDSQPGWVSGRYVDLVK